MSRKPSGSQKTERSRGRQGHFEGVKGKSIQLGSQIGMLHVTMMDEIMMLEAVGQTDNALRLPTSCMIP
ncbi:hypothetical protein M378DRAFT_17372 [Amanita muscaria Koide BX008]|uniref:Uncharacterized protein n=1 Tax=Amanita muscaria (strain Koide BX008) TaxID=946122 RepID=A0A0C2WJ15_AMAMK|nr:hypothetical protein M378DRAFT_17372 [Amanita muscaria Koide BX008]